jgi:hypothetical protein
MHAIARSPSQRFANGCSVRQLGCGTFAAQFAAPGPELWHTVPGHYIFALDPKRHSAAVTHHQCLLALTAIPLTRATLQTHARLAQQAARLRCGAGETLTISMLAIHQRVFGATIGFAAGSLETARKIALVQEDKTKAPAPRRVVKKRRWNKASETSGNSAPGCGCPNEYASGSARSATSRRGALLHAMTINR